MHKKNIRKTKESSSSDSDYGSFESAEGACCTIFGIESSSDSEDDIQPSTMIQAEKLSASTSLESNEDDFHDETIGITQNHPKEQLGFFTRLKRGIAKLICHEEDEFSLTEIDDLDAEILWTSSRALDVPRFVVSPTVSETNESNSSTEEIIQTEENIDAKSSMYQNNVTLQDHVAPFSKDENNPTTTEVSEVVDHTNDNEVDHTIGNPLQNNSNIEENRNDIRNDNIPSSLPPPPPPSSMPRRYKKKQGTNKLGKMLVDDTTYTDSNVDQNQMQSGYISPESSFEEEGVIDAYMSFISPDDFIAKKDVPSERSTHDEMNDDPLLHVEESELNLSVMANVGSPTVDVIGNQMQISNILAKDFRDILIHQEWSNIAKSNKSFISPSNSEEENEDATELSTLPDSLGSRSISFTNTLNRNDDVSTKLKDRQVDLRDIFIQQEGLYGCSNTDYLSSDDYDEDNEMEPSLIQSNDSHSVNQSRSNDDTLTIKDGLSDDDSIPDDVMDKVLSALNKVTSTAIHHHSITDEMEPDTMDHDELKSIILDETNRMYKEDCYENILSGSFRSNSSHNTSTFAKTEALISAAKDLIHKNKVNTSIRRAKTMSQYDDSRDDNYADHKLKEDRITPDENHTTTPTTPTTPTSTWMNANGNDRLREKIMRRKAQFEKFRHQLSKAKSMNSTAQ